MARLVMYSNQVPANRYIDVEYPAWVIVGYPRYVPQILDMVTMDEVLHDLYLRTFAYDTSLYGELDTFDDPQRIDFRDQAQLRQWQNGRLIWNRAYRPLFYRDIWPILYRPDQFRFLCDALAQSNYPHDQNGAAHSTRRNSPPPPKKREPAEAAGLVATAPRWEFASIEALPLRSEPLRRPKGTAANGPCAGAYGSRRIPTGLCSDSCSRCCGFRRGERVQARRSGQQPRAQSAADAALDAAFPLATARRNFSAHTDYQLLFSEAVGGWRFVNDRRGLA